MKNRFHALTDSNSYWEQVKSDLQSPCEERLGSRQGHTRAGSEKTPSPRQKRDYIPNTRLVLTRQKFRKCRKSVQRNRRKLRWLLASEDKRVYTDIMAYKAQEAAEKQDLKSPYDITKGVAGRKIDSG